MRSPGRRLALAGLALLVMALFGWALWLGQAPQRAIRSLPPEQRARLYERTIEELITLCEPPVAEGLLEHCQAQRSFVSEFPECKAECRDILTRQTARFRPR